MFSGGMDAGEDGMLPSEIIRELKEEVEDLEKERNKMTVDLEMLKDSNAEMDMKISILEDEKQHGGGSEGGAGLKAVRRRPRSFLEAWKASSSLIPI